nr:hypothetical protein TDPV-309 [Oriental turtle dovepox virus]
MIIEYLKIYHNYAFPILYENVCLGYRSVGYILF